MTLWVWSRHHCRCNWLYYGHDEPKLLHLVLQQDGKVNGKSVLCRSRVLENDFHEAAEQGSSDLAISPMHVSFIYDCIACLSLHFAATLYEYYENGIGGHRNVIAMIRKTTTVFREVTAVR